MVDRIGQQLGNYHLIGLLGHGALADVYLGEHIYLKTYAAIKVLHAQLAGSELPQFLQEARLLNHLRHPNIVPGGGLCPKWVAPPTAYKRCSPAIAHHHALRQAGR
jgi:serine/threonine protein kinase